MITEYKVNLEKKTKNELIAFISQLQNLLNKRDKQIDLMADFMHKTGTGRRAFSCAFRQNDECDENGCRHCIKQYFVDKAKKETKET